MKTTRYARTAAWISLLSLVCVLAPAARAKEEARGQEYVFEFPYPTSTSPYVPDKVSWPATILVVRCERGEVKNGERRIKVIPRVANGSYSDLKITVVISLLDGDGNVVYTETETDGLEEEAMTPFSFRFKIPEEQAQTIETCRVLIRAQPN